MTAFNTSPFSIVFQQLYIKAVKASGRLDVEGIFTDLFNGRDSSQWQEKTEMIREVRIVADNDFTAIKVFGLKIFAVCCQQKFSLGLCGGGACF